MSARMLTPCPHLDHDRWSVDIAFARAFVIADGNKEMDAHEMQRDVLTALGALGVQAGGQSG
jgi:hypothetical protein